jgi:hypothetical protein
VRNRAELLKYLASHPCVDCGETDPVVLEFDHLRDKTHEVPALATMGVSWARVMREIDKCEVVCCNCHRKRTHQRSGSWRLPAV